MASMRRVSANTVSEQSADKRVEQQAPKVPRAGRGLDNYPRPVLGGAMTKIAPDFSFERAAMDRGYLRVAGVDEVGRGPLCGPVTACAVVLDPAQVPDGLNDSKQLTPKKRAMLLEALLDVADVSIAHASVEEVDSLNIYHATHLAMCRALDGLSVPADYALIDGNKIPKDIQIPAEAIVKGDARSVSIAAASIAAKMCRDQIMVDLAQQFPGYGWERNAGYGTKEHLEALVKKGVTPHHRRSFKPVHNILYQE